MNPHSAHAMLVGQNEQFLGGGDPMGAATLEFPGLAIKVPCTHTEIIGEFTMVTGGQSPNNFVERCEFRVAAMNGKVPRKGIKCTLMLNATAKPMAMQLLDGGLQPGGEIYRYSLADENYRA